MSPGANFTVVVSTETGPEGGYGIVGGTAEISIESGPEEGGDSVTGSVIAGTALGTTRGIVSVDRG